jgi:nitrite reductase/ring-hydroxylating ferredoxin subunit
VRVRVARLDDFAPGDRVVVEAARRSVGVFRVGEDFYALRNRCPHLGAPLCLGEVHPDLLASAPGRVEPVEGSWTIACPWHGWEYDLATGRSRTDPTTLKVRTYPAGVDRVVEPSCEQVSPEAARHIPDGTFVRAGTPPTVESFPVSVEDDYVVVDIPD